MSVSYVGFRGKVISREWAAVLTAATQEVAFQIDSGHRTMGEQQALLVRRRADEGALFGQSVDRGPGCVAHGQGAAALPRARRAA